MIRHGSRGRRTLIISNRLPFTVDVEKDGDLAFKESAGGVASGLSAYLDQLKASSSISPDYLWVGWPGVTVDDDLLRERIKHKASSDYHAYPVFLSSEVMDNFYHGFCNKTIWPLFHYFPSYAAYEERYWEDYTKVNRAYCDAVMEVIKPDDIVWIHDYHLMLLPQMLRERMPNVPIGFFLHIPFPSFEMFRLLPGKWRREILEGLLGSDLVGFHAPEYTQYFLRCVLRILGYEHNVGEIVMPSTIVMAGTFPMGIDFERFNRAATDPEIQHERDALRKSLGDVRVILSIDRLDYSKGIINRMQGYEIFLEQHPEWRKKVMLALFITPSRIGVQQYKETRQQIEELVGRINGKYGSLDWTPIVYQYRFYPFQSLVALYTLSDVALITPLRDGMNLVAKEYIASRADCTGVLVLSEMAGAQKELGEAVIINPNSTQEIADSIQVALTMPVDEQIRRNHIMQDRLRRYDVVRWAEDFMDELLTVKEAQARLDARMLGPSTLEQLAKTYRQARRRLILLDYDGTLVPYTPRPEMALPSESALRIMSRLSDDPANQVVLISGRDKTTLEHWFGMLPVVLVAEHGVWSRTPEDGQWKMMQALSNSWKPSIHPLLEAYVARVPGSLIEEKDYSLVWHYRNADPEQGPMRAKELLDHLLDLTANMDVQVLPGSKVIEVKSASVNKGAAASHLMAREAFDFILAIGDDWTDEDVFRALPEGAYSIKVGASQSYARFSLHGPSEAIELLDKLIASAEGSQSPRPRFVPA